MLATISSPAVAKQRHLLTEPERKLLSTSAVRLKVGGCLKSTGSKTTHSCRHTRLPPIPRNNFSFPDGERTAAAVFPRSRDIWIVVLGRFLGCHALGLLSTVMPN